MAGLPCSVVSTPSDSTKYSSKVNSVFQLGLGTTAGGARRGAGRPAGGLGSRPGRAAGAVHSSDQALLFTSRHRDGWGGDSRFAIPDAELVEAMADKALFSTLAERLSLPVPAP